MNCSQTLFYIIYQFTYLLIHSRCLIGFGPRLYSWPKLSSMPQERSWDKCCSEMIAVASRRHIQIKVSTNTLEVHSSLGKSATRLAAAGTYAKSCWHLCTFDGTKKLLFSAMPPGRRGHLPGNRFKKRRPAEQELDCKVWGGRHIVCYEKRKWWIIGVGKAGRFSLCFIGFTPNIYERRLQRVGLGLSGRISPLTEEVHIQSPASSVKRPDRRWCESLTYLIKRVG